MKVSTEPELRLIKKDNNKVFGDKGKTHQSTGKSRVRTKFNSK